MFCSECGKEVIDGAVVCPGCGCMVKKDEANDKTNFSEGDKKTQVSVILGVIGIVFAWFLALVGHIVSIVGIIMGIKEYKKTGKITGLTLSIIGEVCSIISSIIGAVAMSGMY